MFRKIALIVAGFSLLVLMSCGGKPDTVEPVDNFDLESYLGKWYEIARLDHGFERGLEQVYAQYERLPDGNVRVLNTGFNAEEGEWETAEGEAYLAEADNVGFLKVSFFGPFYSSYVIFYLTDDLSFVSGYNDDYLWLLSRSPTVSQEVKDRFVTAATERGFPVEELIWVDQSKNLD